MTEVKLAWEPINTTPLDQLTAQFGRYAEGKGGVSVLRNGTLLFIKNSNDPAADAKQAMAEAKYLTDFKVVRLKDGGYLVAFHEAVAVYVGDDEFATIKDEVQARYEELIFPGEVFLGKHQGEEMLIGLYARGKLQRDANAPELYKRVVG